MPRTAPCDPCEPIGLAEVAGLCAVPRKTAYQWWWRKILPEPDFNVDGNPAWNRATIEAWAESSGRIAEVDGRVS